jgi:uncharacterized phosphosugar-binding protein
MSGRFWQGVRTVLNSLFNDVTQKCGRYVLVGLMLAAGGLAGCGTARSDDGLSVEGPAKQAATQSTPRDVSNRNFADPVLADFSRRVALTRTVGVPVIRDAAIASAQRVLDFPNACINVPYGPQSTFAEEILNRAGGLANALPPEERPRLTTPNDIILVSVRSWKQDETKARKMIDNARTQGWLVVLFASKAGMPADIKPDYLIDNGGSGLESEDPAVNSTANIMNAWVWTVEYAAALTRAGSFPGVLYSAAMAGSDEHNKKIQSREGRKFLGSTRTPIPQDSLATLYLATVDQLLNRLNDATTQRQIEQASNVIAAHIKAGGQVVVSTCTHFMMAEVFLDKKSPMKPIHVVWRSKKAFADNVKPDDIIFWIGYIGMSTRYEDYFEAMKATGAKLVTSYVTDSDVKNNAVDRLAHIEQHWQPPDAEIAVPFAPGFIAPISGIDQSLIFRMVDERVAAKLKDSGK